MFLVLIAVASLTVLAVAALRHARTERLARFRAAWGMPIERTRRMDAMAASHRARIAASNHGASLDDRTWRDLLMDDVFAAVDRTQSTLGQHALYHRLRTAPVADHLAAFEALVDRMSTDAAARERAQLALDRLQDPHGLRHLVARRARRGRAALVVRHLSRAVRVDDRRWRPWARSGRSASRRFVALLVVNVAVRYATDPHVGTMAVAFRQCAPLIATAGELRFLAGADIDPIVAPLARPTCRSSGGSSRFHGG